MFALWSRSTRLAATALTALVLVTSVGLAPSAMAETVQASALAPNETLVLTPSYGTEESEEGALPGSYFQNDMQVQVRTEGGAYVEGAPVTFEVVKGGAVFEYPESAAGPASSSSTVSTVTNAQGEASPYLYTGTGPRLRLADPDYYGPIEIQVSTPQAEPYVFTNFRATRVARLERIGDPFIRLANPGVPQRIPLQQKVVGADGAGLAGVEVVFALEWDSGYFVGSGTSLTATTDEEGIATTIPSDQPDSDTTGWFVSDSEGLEDSIIDVRAEGVGGFGTVIQFDRVTALTSVTGDRQYAQPGDTYSEITVRAANSSGVSLQGRRAYFQVFGPATLVCGERSSGYDSVTDASGLATLPEDCVRVDPGATAADGVVTIRASAGSARTELTMLIGDRVRAWKIVAVSGGGQSTAVGTDFAAPMVVRATDERGIAASFAPLTFRVAPAGSASFVVQPGEDANTVRVVADQNGMATSPLLRAGPESGPATVFVSSEDSLEDLYYDFWITGGTARIEVHSPAANSSVLPGGYWLNSSVGVFDADANAVENETVTFTVESGPIGFTPSGGDDGQGRTVTSTTGPGGSARAGVLYASPTRSGPAVLLVETASGVSTRVPVTVEAFGPPVQLIDRGGSGWSVPTGGQPPMLQGRASAADGGPAGLAPITVRIDGGTGTTFADGSTETTATTDIRGDFSVALGAAGPVPGDVTVTASSPAASDLVWTGRVTGVAQGLAVAGGDQRVHPDEPLAPLSVRVTDSEGEPVAGQVVTFTYPGVPTYYSYPCTANPETSSTRTGPDGIATLCGLRAPAGRDAVGRLLIAASLPGSGQVDFDVEVIPYPAPDAVVDDGGGERSASAGSEFTGSPSVRATASGESAGYADVRFRIDGGTGSGFRTAAGVETEVVVRSTSQGYATAPVIVAGTTPGAFTLTATSEESPGIAPITWAYTVTGLATAIRIVEGGDQKVYVGGATAPIVVQALDDEGRPAVGQLVTFTLSDARPHVFSGGDRRSDRITDAEGLARLEASAISVGDVPGPFTVGVEIDGVEQGSIALEALAYPIADRIVASGGGGQTAAPGTAFGSPLTALVSNAASATVVPKVPVTYTVTAGDAYFVDAAGQHVPSAVVPSSTTGVAISPRLFAGSQGGSVLVSATAPDASAAALFDMTVSSTATRLALVSGDDQRVRVGSLFAPLTVRVTAADGSPVANQSVRFTSSSIGVAAFSGQTRSYAYTDAEGIASVQPGAGTTAGSATVTASTGSLVPVQFRMSTTALPVATALVDPIGDGQIANPGQTFGAPLAVSAVDGEGVGAPETRVTFAITGDAAFSTGGTSAVVVANGLGRAVSPSIVAGASTGAVTVTATAPGVAAVPFALRVSPPNRAPEITFSTDASIVEIDAPVAMVLGGSDPDGDALRFRFDFGDGTAERAGAWPASGVTHRYSEAGTYLLRAIVSDGTTETVRTTRVSVILPEPLVAVAGDDRLVVAGADVRFTGAGSRPAGLIRTATWDFGDGSSATGLVADHRYSAAGTYTVRLTVANGTETATSTLVVSVTPAPVVPGLTVTVRTGGALLSGATVSTTLPSGQRISSVSNGAGVATLDGMPDGSSSVFVTAPGYLPLAATAVLRDGSGSLEANLASGEVGATALETRQLTYDEIVDRGIDPAAPENTSVFEAEVHLAVAGEAVDLPVALTWNPSGVVAVSETGGGGGGGGTSDCGCVVQGGYSYTPTVVHAEGRPAVQWMVVPIGGSYLKEFFEARMIVQNLAAEPFRFTDGLASLSLPAGISLAPTAAQQSLAVAVPEVPAGGSQTVSWTLRGDVEGEYPLTADYTAVMQPTGDPIRLVAATQAPLKVWGGSALSMTVSVDPTTNAYDPFRVTVKLKNVTPERAGTIVYNPAVQVRQGSNMLLAPDTEYTRSVPSLRPGESLTAEFVFYTLVGGRTLIDDSSFVGLFSTSTGGAVEVDRAPLVLEPRPTEVLDVESEWVDIDESTMALAVAWEVVPDAVGYSVWGRDDVLPGSSDWERITETLNPDRTDMILLPERSEQLHPFYAVVAQYADGTTRVLHSLVPKTVTAPEESEGPVGIDIGVTSSSEAPACVDVLHIAAAGSGEVGTIGRPLGVLNLELHDVVAPHRDFAAVYLDYPARKVPLLLNGDVDFTGYYDSIETGVANMTTFLRSRMESCKNETYILSGYSQGAVVMSRVLDDQPDLSSVGATGRSRIEGLYLVANPSQNEDIGGRMEGSGSWTTGVSALVWNETIPSTIEDRTTSLCAYPDVVCGLVDIADISLRAGKVFAPLGVAVASLQLVQGYDNHVNYWKRDAPTLRRYAQEAGWRALGVPVLTSPELATDVAGDQRFIDATPSNSIKTVFSPTGERVQPQWRIESSGSPAVSLSPGGLLSGTLAGGTYAFGLSVSGARPDQKRTVGLTIKAGWAAEVAEVRPVSTAPTGYVLKPLAVQVLDASGRPVIGAEVIFRVDGPAAFAGGSQQQTVRTDQQGYAVSTTPVPTGAAGALRTSAEVSGQSSVDLGDQVVPAMDGLPAGVTAVQTPIVVNGKVVLQVVVANGSPETVAVTVATRFGTKKIPALVAGESGTLLFSTGLKKIAAGEMTITAATPTVSGSRTLRYDAWDPQTVLVLTDSSASATALAGGALPPYTVRLMRADGTAVVGAEVAFTVTGAAAFGSGASASPTNRAVTDASGFAVSSTPLVAGTSAGAVTATAAAAGAPVLALIARSVTAPDVALTSRADVYVGAAGGRVVLTVEAVNTSTVPVDMTLSTRFGSKKVLGVQPGATASAEFPTGLAAVGAGTATVRLQAGAAVNEVRASHPAAGPGKPAVLSPGGTAQTVWTGDPLARPTVKVLDTTGVPVAGVSVTFEIAGPAAFAGGSTAVAVSDSAGWAVAPPATAASTPGTASITARASGPRPAALPAVTVASRPAPTELVTGSAATRTEAGRVVLDVVVTNTFSAPVDVAITSRYGKKSIVALAPGATATTTIKTGLASVAAGTVSVVATAGASQQTLVLPYAAR
ncbi:PKD domain-containing protein [Rathayibacter sp. VKM Ac-2754]|uniref:PKD domain-containing protein n=1 Tax=Rathayibacter sp. VKM Ac-2754 TaxID=2609251 RepID=UPI00135967A1|nr:PKD domain-containing protein [Rathayibacter sp. VKM Ac-2754]MWV58884.1 PKD domain-containing protein [Rathayibacter sp. VKM Ac-2754]